MSLTLVRNITSELPWALRKELDGYVQSVQSSSMEIFAQANLDYSEDLYALEINDPWLAKLVRGADAGEVIDTIDFSETPETNEQDANEEDRSVSRNDLSRGRRGGREVGRAANPHVNTRKLVTPESACEHRKASCLYALW